MNAKPTAADGSPRVTLRFAVDRMVELRAEHRPILEKIVTDAGMEPATRRVLVEHLLQEEDEKLAQIQQLSAGAPSGAAAPAPAAPPGAARASGPSLTVGSLRTSAMEGTSAPRSVGSLRRA
ncbi:MAG: hypothetical protein JNJ88_20090 [Planctomycetes bacterium]|nr:hypothetical protein [Planctomycetota bacterium]